MLIDPSALVALLERERDALTRENKALRVGLDRLIDSASASSDMVLPLIAEDIIRCTQELSVAKGQLAMASTGGSSSETVSTFIRRKETLECELKLARELHAEAGRIAPLLRELRSLSGRPAHSFCPESFTSPHPIVRAEELFGVPDSRAVPEPKIGGSVLASVRSGLQARVKPLGQADFRPSLPADVPVAPAGPLQLQSEPKKAQPSATKPTTFASSLFGKILG